MSDKFDKNDVGVLVEAVNLIPEIKLCTIILKRARGMKLDYPVKNYNRLIKLLGGEKNITKDGHSFSAAHIRRYITKEQFPISDESELATAIYLGLCRCREDMRWATMVPDNAVELLKIANEGGN
jgi:hypothetical protein